MGSGYNFTCSKCHRKIEFIEGYGFRYMPEYLMNLNGQHRNLLDSYENGINKSKLKRNMIEKQFILNDNYTYKTYICPNCKEITNELWFELLPIKEGAKKNLFQDIDVLNVILE